MSPLRTFAIGLSAAILAVVVLGSATGRAASATSSTIYVAVSDAEGKPAAGLGARDFVVEIDGHAVPVLEARPATEPLSVAFVVDASLSDVPYVRSTMKSVVSLLRSRDPRTRAAFVLSLKPPVTFVSVNDHGADFGLVTAPVINSYRLMPAILEATKALRQEDSPRRIVFTIDRLARGSDDESYVDQVGAALRKSRSALWGVAMRDALGGVSRAERDLWDVTKASGGVREPINDPIALEATASRVAGVILGQYAVSYTPPAAVARETRVGVKRPDVRVFAPGW
jgi:hypothetical protein